MKILYIGGESAKFVIHTCNSLCEAGNEVTAVVQEIDEYDKDNPVTLHKNLKRINMDYKNFFSPLNMKNGLIYEMSKNKPDFIMGSHAPLAPVLYELAKTYGIPWGIMILDIPTHTMRTERGRMKHWNYWFDFLKQADVIVFNNTIARDEFNRYTGNWFDDNYIIHYGTNMPEEEELSGAKIEGDYVLSLCRLHPIKNCKMIPQALGLLKKDLKYVAIGRDAGELELIKSICKQNDIEFIYKGTVTEEEKWKLIRNCAMMIYPQDTEYIAGQAILEGMWAGKPVLAGNFDILKELYGKHPFYFDTKSIEDLAKKIAYVRSIDKKLMEYPYKAASAHAMYKASYKRMGEELSNLFKRYMKNDKE